MAYVFETGVKVELSQIKTAPVLPGTVQLTPSGNLIVLMRDAQSTGGYPRILQLDESAINQIARLQVGSSIKFQL
jgi:allophanate hydrolase subunit 2